MGFLVSSGMGLVKVRTIGVNHVQQLLSKWAQMSKWQRRLELLLLLFSYSRLVRDHALGLRKTNITGTIEVPAAKLSTVYLGYPYNSSNL